MPLRRNGTPEPAADIKRYPAEEGASAGTDIHGYPSSPERADPADIKRYPSPKAPPDAPATIGLPEGAPLFKDSGFESIDDYLEHIDDLWRKENGLPPLSPDELRRVGVRDGEGSRQVGLRLPEADFRRLQELGAEYGVAPATMARMIVVGALRSRRVDPGG